MTHEELWEHIGKGIDAKLDQKLDEKLEPIKKNTATKVDIHEITEDMAGVFHNTWEKMDETNERVTSIEDHLDEAWSYIIRPTWEKLWARHRVPGRAQSDTVWPVDRQRSPPMQSVG